MKYSFFVFFIIIGSCVNSGKEEINSVVLKIITSGIVIKEGESKYEIAVEMTNYTDTSLLFYNFKDVGANFLLEEDYLNGECTSGTAMFVLKDNSLLPVYTLVSKEMDYKPVTQDTLKNVLNRLTHSFRDNSMIVKGSSSMESNLVLDFTGYELEKGEYELFLIYYTGNNIGNIVSGTQQKKDSRRYNANIFRGWVKSNTVSLVVE